MPGACSEIVDPCCNHFFGHVNVFPKLALLERFCGITFQQQIIILFQVEMLSRAAHQKATEREVVYAVLKRLFDWSLSRHLNVRGTQHKKSIYEHPLFSVIIGK